MMDMTSIFRDATLFDEDIRFWDLSSVQFAMYAFEGATSYDSNLCSWGDQLREDAFIDRMFESSGCPETGDPDLSKRTPTPFCFSCDDCTEAGDTCTRSSQCCDNLSCIRGICTNDIRGCSLTGRSCERYLDCCSDLRCVRNTCERCKSAQSKCSLNTQCCSMNCQKGKCVGNCKAESKICTRDSECCSNNCRASTARCT